MKTHLENQILKTRLLKVNQQLVENNSYMAEGMRRVADSMHKLTNINHRLEEVVSDLALDNKNQRQRNEKLEQKIDELMELLTAETLD